MKKSIIFIVLFLLSSLWASIEACTTAFTATETQEVTLYGKLSSAGAPCVKPEDAISDEYECPTCAVPVLETQSYTYYLNGYGNTYLTKLGFKQGDKVIVTGTLSEDDKYKYIDVHNISTQQSERMFAENTIWCCVISADHPKYGCSKSVNIMGGDTVIGEYTYQKMLNRNYEYMMSIREDGKKVYAYIDDEDKDVLMYDFGLEVGDTMPIINREYLDPEFPWSGKVIAVDSITLMDGRRAKRIHYDNLEADIEYVGRSSGFFRPLENPFLISTCGGPILCCSLNGEPIYEGGQGDCDLLFEFFGIEIITEEPIDTIPLYAYVGDSPGSSTIEPIDPNQIIAWLKDNYLYVHDYSGNELTFSLFQKGANTNAPKKTLVRSAQTFKNEISVEIPEDGNYEILLTCDKWDYSVVGEFSYPFVKSAIVNPKTTEHAATKFLHNGQLLIRHGDKIYNLQGIEVIK